MTTKMIRQIEAFDTHVHSLRMDDVVDLCERVIDDRGRLLIGVVNAAKLVKMRSDAALRASVEQADICVADGMSLVWALRALGDTLPERVAGIDIMDELLRLAHQRSFRVFLLGARPEVVQRVQERVREDYPNAVVAGTHHGYFEDEAGGEVARQIGAARADVLFVAMTSPRKERFLARWQDTLNVPVCHGVGGAFDVYAGVVARAPRAWQRCGMEWLYRVLQEPRRLAGRYIRTNSVFLWWLSGAVARRWVGRTPLPNQRVRLVV